MTPAISKPEAIQAHHRLDSFDSGEPNLDEWLRGRAMKNHASGASRCFVVCSENRVIGYYSLSAGAISHQIAPKNFRRNMPDPLPVLLLGRLAVDRRCQNIGLGKALLRDALLRAVGVGVDAGVFAVLVHAISDSAKRFYLSYGFVPSPLEPMTLMMTLQTVRGVLLEG